MGDDAHPFDRLGMSRSERIGFWDGYADSYSSFQQGDIPGRIVRRLADIGFVSEDSSVLEIGSGPGTYSLPLAEAAGSVLCLDSSPRMLTRLEDEAGTRGLDNIRTRVAEWPDMELEEKFDLCIAALCPGVCDGTSVRRMEELSSDGCAMVNWVENHGDDLNAAIWSALGRDCGSGFRKRSPALDWLRENGREVVIEEFETEVSADIPVRSLAEREDAYFRSVGIDADTEPIVREALRDRIEGDVCHYRARNRMRLVYWRSGRSSPGWLAAMSEGTSP